MSPYYKVFFKLPVVAQEILLTLLGVYTYYQRRSGSYNRYFNEVVENTNISKADIDLIKIDKLNGLMKSAKNVEAYSHLAVEKTDSIQGALDQLEKFPILEKKSLKTNGAKYVDRSEGKGKLITLKTTGSTGTPLEIVCTADARKRNYAFFDWFIQLHGGKPRGRSVTIAGRQVRPPSTDKPPYWLLDRFNNTLYMSAYHINKDTLGEYCRKLTDFQPTYIDSYPSVLYEISCYAIARGISLPKPLFICTSSETLSKQQREVIESAFSCPVRNQYGTAEMCVFGYECLHGRMHIREDYGLIELYGSIGGDQDQELLCTGFINNTMPLIRYRVGDRVKLADQSGCPCGSSYPAVAEIVGRVDDVVVSKSGKRYSRLSPVLKGLPILESQYVQDEVGLLNLKVVPLDTNLQELKRMILLRLKEYFNEEFVLEVTFVEEIPRGKGGKFRSVINNCS